MVLIKYSNSINYFRFAIILFLFFIEINTQSTNDCGVKYGCFLHPAQCVDTNCMFIFKWSDDNDKTHFQLTGKINKGATADTAWLAIGFSKDRIMGDDCVVMCKHIQSEGKSSVEHYYNVEEARPDVLDPNYPTVGLSESSIETNNGFLTCKFTRLKQNDTLPHYFDIHKHFYILGAYGPISGDVIQFHHDARTASATSVNFESYNVYSSSNFDQPKIKIHGCLMVFAWVLLASTGIIIARYYKYLLPRSKPCGVQTWFLIHRPIMVSVSLVSIAAFIMILWNNNWLWVTSGDKVAFAHSMFGIVTVCLVAVQPIVGMLRCDKDHPKRFIFNYFHISFGLCSFVFATTAIFLATFMSKSNLDDRALKLLIGWTAWIFLLIFINEILSYIQTQQSINLNSDETPLLQINKSFERYGSFKSFLLVIHVLIAIAVSTVLILSIANPDLFD